ncbi:MAG: DMT family transporter [Methylophilaceae bacterium]|nr:DMT family transporter [Methylophilaceae bacterium]
MTAFAANSLLCRLALANLEIDAASFASIRILSGALALWLLVKFQGTKTEANGNWRSAFALFSYATAFSYAYINLSAGTGALLLFGAVQSTMILYGLRSGERLNLWQSAGFVLALLGLIVFMLPGISTPSLIDSILMIGAGIAWGAYSLLGKGAKKPLEMTAGNFLRAVPFAVGFSILMMSQVHLSGMGILLATLSGAIASGMGYAIWYLVVRETTTTNSAIMQLSVPVIAGIGGIAFLDEAVTLHQLISALAILMGIAVVILKPNQKHR